MREKLEALSHLLMNKRKVLIVTHTNPDPDSIASAYAMRHLFASWGINSVLVYGGIIGRAENKVMINRLRIPLRSIQTVNPFNFKIISLVDTQPSSGNNPLPPSLVPSIVVDHHSARKTSLLKKIPFVDIRPQYGSTSSIMAEYLMESDVDINRRLATALYYGIKSDTRDLGRSANEVDIKISATLYPKVLVKTLSQIEYPRLPREYFRVLQKALSRTTWYPPRGVLISELGVIGDADMVAVVADFLIRVEGIKWVLVLAQRDQEIFFSLRTTDYPKPSADRLARALIKGIEGGSAGGHDTTAGGRVGLPSLQGIQQVKEKMRGQFLKGIGCIRAKKVPFV